MLIIYIFYNKSILLFFLVPLFNGCKGTYDLSDNYAAFQQEKEGKWGIIDYNGIVIYDSIFKNIPTSPTEDRFFVKDDNELWSLYSTKEKGIPIESGFKSISNFKNGLSVVVKNKQPISVIDKDGNVQFKMDMYEGKKVTSMFSYSNCGLARFIVGDKIGCVDINGNVVIPPFYTLLGIYDKNIIALHEKYENEYVNRNYQDIEWVIMNFKGDSIGHIKGFTCVCGTPNPNLFFVNSIKNQNDVSSEQSENWGLMDKKGKWIVEPTFLWNYGNNRYFLFKKDNNWGVMDYDGKIIITPKYNYLGYATDDRFWMSQSSPEDEDITYSFIDLTGNRVGEKSFINFYSNYINECVPIYCLNKKWAIINKDGEIIDSVLNAHWIDGLIPSSKVFNDLVDLEAYYEALKITINEGINGLSFDNSLAEILNYAGKQNNEDLTDNIRYPLNGKDYLNAGNIYYVKLVNDIITYFRISFPKPMVTSITNPNTGFTIYPFLNPLTPIGFGIDVPNRKPMDGHMDELFEVFLNHIKPLGRIAESSDNHVVVFGNNGFMYIILKTEDMVSFYFKPMKYADL